MHYQKLFSGSLIIDDSIISELNMDKRKASDKLIIAKVEKTKRAAEAVISNVKKAKHTAEIVLSKVKTSKMQDALIKSNKELAVLNREKTKRAAELVVANVEKAKRAAELLIANVEKAELSNEVFIANKKLTFQNKEKAERITELTIANIEKAKLAAELIISNVEKAKRHARLVIANVKKAKLAAELIIANEELAFQNQEKQKRAAELFIADVEKAKLAANLVIANIEKAKQAAKLAIASRELILIKEKGKLTEELINANKVLVSQNEEKEKRASELIALNKELEQFSNANKELIQFAYTASHQLQEPLRTVSNFIQVIEEDYSTVLDDDAHKHLNVIKDAINRMTILINSLLDFSRLGLNKKLVYVDCKILINEVIADLDNIIKSSNTNIGVTRMPKLYLYDTEIRQLFQNLIINSIKFQKKGHQPIIQIKSEKVDEKFRFSISDNGIGISPSHFDRVFEIFQRLHPDNEEYKGNGIGLAYCKKIVQMHKGEIWIESNKGQGVTFYFTIPILTA